MASTTFLPKIIIFKFWKRLWPKMGVAMILTIAPQAQNVSNVWVRTIDIISGVKGV